MKNNTPHIEENIKVYKVLDEEYIGVPMSVSKIYQKELSEAVRLATSGDSLEVGKSVVYYVKHVLTQENVKKELNLDFDEIEIHPAQHSANTADVILLKKGKLVGMINVKTCVSGNLRATLSALRKSKRTNEDGLIIFGLACTKSDSEVKRILGMVFINKKFLFGESIDVLMDLIIAKLKKKQKDEGCKELTPYSLNQMIALESLISSQKAYDMAVVAKKSADEAKRSADEAKRSAEEAKRSAEEAKRSINEIKDRISAIEKKIDQIHEIMKKLIESKK